MAKQKRRSYTAVAERVIAATNEINAALREAFDHPQVRVRLGPTDDLLPMQLHAEVTRITKHTVVPARHPHESAREITKALRLRWRIADRTDPQLEAAREAAKRPVPKKSRARRITRQS